jgi:sigma-B regulation protein RsbU (phosphoserine phosphatase)
LDLSLTTANPSPLTVLVVDDEAFNVDYLLQELEDYGVNTLSAANGVEALELVGEHSPDLVLLDIMMPKMDGFEVLAKMKSDAAMRDIPVIIISAHSEMAMILKGIAMGAEDYLPKPFDPLLLKARVNASLEKKRFRNLEKAYLQGLERELEIGRQIQEGFLPREIQSPEGWQIATFFRAAREVSGDFYDVFPLAENQLALVIGDVTDKGVGAALYMALFRTLFRTLLSTNGFTGAGSGNSLSAAAKFINDYICTVHESESFCTAFVGVLDTSSGKLSYVSAGHDHPLVLRAGGSLEEIHPTGPAIGAMDDAEFALGELQLNPGDALFCYTDGLLDIRNPAGDLFGGEKLRALVMGKGKDIDALVAEIVAALDAFASGALQYDDITILSLARK